MDNTETINPTEEQIIDQVLPDRSNFTACWSNSTGICQ